MLKCCMGKGLHGDEEATSAPLATHYTATVVKFLSDLVCKRTGLSYAKYSMFFTLSLMSILAPH